MYLDTWFPVDPVHESLSWLGRRKTPISGGHLTRALPYFQLVEMKSYLASRQVPSDQQLDGNYRSGPYCRTSLHEAVTMLSLIMMGVWLPRFPTSINGLSMWLKSSVLKAQAE